MFPNALAAEILTDSSPAFIFFSLSFRKNVSLYSFEWMVSLSNPPAFMNSEKKDGSRLDTTMVELTNDETVTAQASGSRTDGFSMDQLVAKIEEAGAKKRQHEAKIREARAQMIVLRRGD